MYGCMNVRNGIGGVVRGNSPDTPSCYQSNIYERNTYPCIYPTIRCSTPTSWATFYNLELVIAPAFSLNTYETSRVRQKVLENLYLQKENGNSLFIWLGEKYMGN